MKPMTGVYVEDQATRTRSCGAEQERDAAFSA